MTVPVTNSVVAEPGVKLGTVTLNYGGAVLRFVTDDPTVSLVLDGPRSRFRVPDADHANCENRCAMRDLSLVAPDNEASTSSWRSFVGPDGGEELRFYAQVREGEMITYRVLTLAPDMRGGTLLQQPLAGMRDIRISFPLDEVVASRLLTRRGALIVHAASITVDGLALVFVGHSGAGKSTITALAESAGAMVLSDDRTILSVEQGIAYAWGTPWHGSYRKGSPERAPIAAICLLAQASEDELLQMSPARAYGEIFTRTVQPTTASADSIATVDGLLDLIGRVPVAELRFRPTEAAFHLVRSSFVATGRAGRERPVERLAPA